MRLVHRTLLAIVVAPLAMAACASASGDRARADSAKATSIADVHRSKCGACHRLVEPSTRRRAELVEALRLHEKRVRLSRAEWAALADYLAPE